MTKPKAERTRISTRLEAIGAHIYDARKRRCRYCHLTRTQLLEDPGRCRATALDKMEGRTPLRLTSQDEAIMREDWGLDPNKLPQVRVYQEMLQLQRNAAALRARISALETARADDGEDRADFSEVAGKPEVQTPAIRRLSRQFNVWPAAVDYRPGEVLLAVELRNGVEHAFIARDQAEADRACRDLAHLDDIFPWLLSRSEEVAS